MFNPWLAPGGDLGLGGRCARSCRALGRRRWGHRGAAHTEPSMCSPWQSRDLAEVPCKPNGDRQGSDDARRRIDLLAGKLARGDSDKAGGNESVKEVRGFMGDVKKVGISWHVGGSWKQGAGVLPQVTPQKGTHLPPKKPETEEQRRFGTGI